MTTKHLLDIVEAVGDKAAEVKGKIDPKSNQAHLLTPLAEGVEALADVLKQLLPSGAVVTTPDPKPKTKAKAKKKVVKRK